MTAILVDSAALSTPIAQSWFSTTDLQRKHEELDDRIAGPEEAAAFTGRRALGSRFVSVPAVE